MIQLHNQLGQIDLSVIDPAEVAALDDGQQKLLAVLVSAVQDREAAQARYTSAVLAKREASAEQVAALAAHSEASDPFPFTVPADIEAITDKSKREAALREAREQHEGRVRAHRQDAARKASIAAYNASH
jgi:hypothetical protein